MNQKIMPVVVGLFFLTLPAHANGDYKVAPTIQEDLRQSLFMPRLLSGVGQNKPFLMTLEQRVDGIRALYEDHFRHERETFEQTLQYRKTYEPAERVTYYEKTERKALKRTEKVQRSWMHKEIALEKRIQKRRDQWVRSLQPPLDESARQRLETLTELEAADRVRLNQEIAVLQKHWEDRYAADLKKRQKVLAGLHS